MLGCSFSNGRKFHSASDRVRSGVSATTLAVRGPPSMRDSFPEVVAAMQPGPCAAVDDDPRVAVEDQEEPARHVALLRNRGPFAEMHLLRRAEHTTEIAS